MTLVCGLLYYFNCSIKNTGLLKLQVLLYAESRWELPVAATQVDVPQTENVPKDHTDQPPAAKKKKTTEHTSVKEVVYFCFLYLHIVAASCMD